MKSRYKVTAISSDKPNLEGVGQLGVSVFHVEMTRKITPFQDLKSVLKLYKYLKQENHLSYIRIPKAGTEWDNKLAAVLD
jgi:hypothetical protein